MFLFGFFCYSAYLYSDQISLKADYQTVSAHFDSINTQSSFKFENNDVVMSKINTYLSNNKRLLSKMLSLSEYYFPIFETYLDRYDLPFELKFLAVVESSLNPELNLNLALEVCGNLCIRQENPIILM